MCRPVNLLLFVLLATSACYRPEWNRTIGRAVEVKPQAPMADPLAAHRPDATSHLVDGQSGGIVELASGLRITVPEGAFVDANRKPVEGPVLLTVRAGLRRSDAIRFGRPTHSGARHLETAGFFQLEARNERGALALAEGVSLEVLVPAVSEKPGIELFVWKDGDWSAYVSSEEPAETDGCLGCESDYLYAVDTLWDEEAYYWDDGVWGDDFWAPTTLPDVQFTSEGYVVQVSKMGWTNVDRYWDDPRERVELAATIDLPKGYEKPQLYFLPDSTTSVLELAELDGQWQLGDLPKGERGLLFALAERGEQIALASEHLVIGDAVPTLKLKKQSQPDVAAALAALD